MSKQDKTTVFVTKYWSTAGIQEIEVEMCDYTMCRDFSRYQSYYHKGDFFYTKDEAIADCENKRRKKLLSLQKQIDKIQKLRF